MTMDVPFTEYLSLTMRYALLQEAARILPQWSASRWMTEV